MEKQNTSASYQAGTNIGSVSGSPLWLLWLRGWIDSKKGEGVAKAYVRLLLDKCAEIEALECLAAEDRLYETRKQGADALATIKTCTETLTDFPGLLSADSPQDIRENVRRQSARNSAETAIREAKQSLFTIYETIMNGDTVLHERILQTRKRASALIHVYVKGLRSGKLKSFEADMSFSERAIENYHNRHKKTDEAINHFATSLEEGEKTV